MGLKCSVIGHKYGDATVERDREEQGSEVVITIQEIETCKRCGDERIVSENKEVTSLATPDDPVAEADAEDDPADAADEESVDADDESSVDTGVEDEPAATDVDEAVDEDAPDVAEGVAGEPDRGAEILDAEADEPVDDELADPSVEEPVGGDAFEDDEPEETEDAVIMGEDDEGDETAGAAAGERAPGEWPEEPDDGGDDWKPDAGLSEDDGTTDDHLITAPDQGTEANGAVTVPDGQFVCPECGYGTPVEASSLRAGDFCPDCRRGTLVHEPDEETRKE